MLMLASVAYSARYCYNSPFTTDATDYLRAADRGFWANYLDSQSRGLWGVISTVRHHPEVRARLWDYLQRENDAAAQRHFHVPLGLYPNVLARALGGQDYVQRLVGAFEGGLVVAIVFCGLRIAGVQVLLAIFASFLVGLSPSVVSTATDVSPHLIFLAAVLLFGFAFARFLQTDRAGLALVAAAALAIAVASLELSLIAGLTSLVLLGLRALHRGARETMAALKWPLLVFLAVLVIGWPGGIIRGSYFLSYGVFLFQALFRRGEYFGNDPLPETILRAAQGSWLVVVVFTMTGMAALLLFLKGRSNPYLQVFGLIAVGFTLQGMLNHFRSGTYSSHFIVSVWVMLALCAQQSLDTVRQRISRTAVISLVIAGVLLATGAASGWPDKSLRLEREQRDFSARAEQVIEFVKPNFPEGATLLANRYDGVWRTYLPAYNIEKTTRPDNLEPRPWAGLRNYFVIADLDGLETSWRAKLDNGDSTLVGGFVISRIHDAQPATIPAEAVTRE